MNTYERSEKGTPQEPPQAMDVRRQVVEKAEMGLL